MSFNQDHLLTLNEESQSQVVFYNHHLPATYFDEVHTVPFEPEVQVPATNPVLVFDGLLSIEQLVERNLVYNHRGELVRLGRRNRHHFEEMEQHLAARHFYDEISQLPPHVNDGNGICPIYQWLRDFIEARRWANVVDPEAYEDIRLERYVEFSFSILYESERLRNNAEAIDVDAQPDVIYVDEEPEDEVIQIDD